MQVRKLRQLTGGRPDYGSNLPLEQLEDAGLVEDGELVDDDQQVVVDYDEENKRWTIEPYDNGATAD